MSPRPLGGVDTGINLLAEVAFFSFPPYSAEEHAMLIETMNAMKDILEAAITRVVKNRGKST